MMQAIILAGGLGTRLRPLTFAVPKPLIPVGEKPILEIVLQNLKAHGVKEVFLAVGYKYELIQVYFQNGQAMGMDVRYCREEKRLGTAGPVRLVRDKFGLTQPALTLNADIMTDLDFQAFYRGHCESRADLTVGVRPYQYTVPFGVVETTGSAVQSITERPTLSFLISCGIYVVNPEVLDLVPPDTFFDMPDLMRDIIGAGGKVRAHWIQEQWVAIESLEDISKELERTDARRTDLTVGSEAPSFPRPDGSGPGVCPVGSPSAVEVHIRSPLH